MYLAHHGTKLVYSLDLGTIRTNATAVATPLPIEGKFPTLGFNDLYVASQFVYYTDSSSRIFRNKLVLPAPIP